MGRRAVDDFDEVYRAYAARIYRYCLFRLNSPQDAEDVTAEVFARFLEKGVDHQSVGPWLFKVAGNLCVDNRRREMRLKPLEDESLFVSTEDSRPWENRDVWRVLSGLKTDEQQVIFLKTMEDLTFNEIARFLGKKPNTVKALFYRGIAKLKGVLKEGSPDARELEPAGV
ncbi:MAG: RNA polymerase sigma factor [Candidatus Aquicultorales bacterium]